MAVRASRRRPDAVSISNDDLGRITQQTSVVSSDGDNLGTINQIYTSDTTGDPAWVTLKTGLFGGKESFVPLAGATFEGDDIHVPVTKQVVHDAPRVDADGHLEVAEEDELYRYYGLDNPGQPDGDVDRNDDTDRDDTDHRDTEPAAPAAAAALVADRDRDDELAQRDVEGRDEVADDPEPTPRRAQDDERSVHAEDGTEAAADTSTGSAGQEGVKPGERTTRLKRYVVTERVVQTIEELPDEPAR